jgi:signal transduction histidine kinase
MSPAPTPPPRPSDNTRRSGGPELRPPGSAPTTDELIAGSLSLNMADFFADALDSALVLVHADGGELATLDTAGQAMVLRARAKKPRLGGLGASSRASQPLHPALLGTLPSGMPRDLGSSGVHENEELGIEAQSTILLPAALSSRIYRYGEGLIGLVWQHGEPLIQSGEEFRAQPSGPGASGADAPWHLAVPIFRPGGLSGTPSQADVIGVIAVYNRDPLWSFSRTHVELLTLHADRVARSLRLAELARQNESRGELMEVLRSIDGGRPDLHMLFPHVRDIVRHLVDAPSFAICLMERRTSYQRQSGLPDPMVIFELAEHDGHPVSVEPRRSSQMPAWWQELRGERVVWVSTIEERVARPDLMRLGWGPDTPAQSLLATQLIGSGTPLGALVVGSPNPDAYAPEHVRLIETLGHAAAIILENVQLSQEREHSLHLAEEKATNLALLNNAVLTLNASLEVDATLRAVAEQAMRFTRGGSCAVFLREPMEKELIWRAPRTAEDQSPPSEVRVPLDWHNVSTAMHTQQFLVLDRLDGEWRDSTSMGRWLAENQIHSCLVLPMERPDSQMQQPPDLDQRRERSPHLGVLVVYMPGRHHPFSPSETGMLQGLASQAAIAISNARLYEDLKTLDRLKDDFILTVSHEFRTPLTTIDGYVSLIGRHADRLDKQKLDQYGKEIRSATEQLTRMISTLVDVNRMDSEPLKIVPEAVNARDAAERALANLPVDSKQRVTNDVPDNLWVSADPDRLPVVFSNLVSNALKYGSQTSPCRVTARIERAEVLAAQGRRVPVGPGVPTQWAVLGVRDFGMGISEGDLHRLFHKFVRLPQTLTTPIRGTGLGLWICKQYLTAMQGDIWVESTYGHGAHFQFCLPVVAPPADG